MITGQQPLTSIEAELERERQATDALAGRLDDASSRLLVIGKAQVAAYRDLARLRVASLAGGAALASALPASLEAAEKRVTALLRRRAEDARALAEAIDAAGSAKSALESERVERAKAVEKAAASVDAAEARAQAELLADSAYRQQLDAAHEADRTAKHAEEKADSSDRELGDKGEAYHQDPLFMYLWRRRFGTPGYRAAPLFRWLDAKVARHAHFLDARADYARLLEIPKRLREHARGRRQVADEAFAVVHDRDQQARVAAGVPALDTAQAEAVSALQDIEARIKENASNAQALAERQQRLAAGEDDAYQQAIDIVATELRSEALKSLHQAAQATPFPEDDVLIARLTDLQREHERLDTAAQELKAAIARHRSRLDELESLRSEFKQRQYDRPGHGFEDGVLVATVLANVLGGMLNRNALWRVLDQQRRVNPPRTDVHFGSGGFGRGSPWGGGFRSGGFGPRGGGFRTGGKF
jgi:hypothetical protein